MNKIVLQVPVDLTLRKEAEKQALAQGFSSLQEAVRIFLSKLATKRIDVSFKEEVVYLSSRAEKRYLKMMSDIKSGKEKVFIARNVEELMEQLNK